MSPKNGSPLPAAGNLKNSGRIRGADVCGKSVEFMMRIINAHHLNTLTLSSPQNARLFVNSVIVQHPLKIGAKFRFDGRLDVVGFAWASSKLTKARVRLWIRYALE